MCDKPNNHSECSEQSLCEKQKNESNKEDKNMDRVLPLPTSLKSKKQSEKKQKQDDSNFSFSQMQEIINNLDISEYQHLVGEEGEDEGILKGAKILGKLKEKDIFK